jgi:Anti-sigma-K factor rskA/Sigma-70, region 4
MGSGYLSALMATLDQLSAEQRAIIELVLQRGKTYEELADMLGMPESRVRELARDALVALAPVSARRVEEDWRGQLADYVLGQQTGPESTATRGHLRRSEPARAWARSLLDSLDTLYEDQDLPTIPEGERGGRERRPRERERPRELRRRREEREREREPRERRPRRELSPEAQDAIRRRRQIAGLGAIAAALLFALLVWPIGVLSGDDDGGGGDDGDQQANTVPQPGQRGAPAGIAIVAQRGQKPQVIVQAASLPPSGRREAYEVWLYNSPQDARSLGAQVTDRQGTFQGAGPLPGDFRRFRFVDVSEEPINQDRRHSGRSVLRGRMTKIKNPAQAQRRDGAAILGQIVLAPPQQGG